MKFEKVFVLSAFICVHQRQMKNSGMNRKCFVLGLDGVPYTLLNTYLEAGILPNLKSILDDGFSLSQMDASIPDVSSASWTSFMTGVNPGEHGIFGFIELRPHSYQIRFPNSHSIQAPTLWDILGKAEQEKKSSLYEKYNEKLRENRKSVVLNIPQTNPAIPMNGILVAGFVASDLKSAVYPDAAFRYLDAMGYVIDVDSTKARDHRHVFLQELLQSFEKRKTAFNYFMKNEEWDLFIAVVTETDRLHHFFFDAAYDENHPFYETFVEFYRNLDGCIMEIYTRFKELSGENGRFMILSDHGFTEIKKEVYVNSYLQNKGFLSLRDDGVLFERIQSGSRAFALDPCRVYLNLKDKFPRGNVSDNEKGVVIKELSEALFALKGENGEEVIRHVLNAGDIYTGPESGRGPDLVCLPCDGFDLKGLLGEKNVFGKRHFTGMHTRHDAHCILPEDISLQGKPHIENMAGIILDYFAGE